MTRIVNALLDKVKRSTVESLRFRALLNVGGHLVPQYRFKWPQMAWWGDGDFNAYLEKFGESEGMNTDRRWMVRQLTRLTTAVEGDTAECGVLWGAGSYLICAANRQSVIQRTHFVFDSFEGLSEPSGHDGSHWRRGDLAVGLADVRRKLAEFENVSYHQGWIPDRFVDVERRRFSFVHIDVDLYEPTRDSIQFFYPRMSPGGIILCDDYGFTTCPGATRAIDGYLADKPEQMLSLCSGGGFLIKGCSTAR